MNYGHLWILHFWSMFPFKKVMKNYAVLVIFDQFFKSEHLTQYIMYCNMNLNYYYNILTIHSS